MGSSFFHIDQHGHLSAMRQEPYQSEDLLQQLLERYPAVLAGARFGVAEPRRWLLVAREMPVPDGVDGGSRWALDHLFLDQDGVPALIEVKRSTDTRSRRAVVGQMLDYAANGPGHWTLSDLRAAFEATHRSAPGGSTEVLRAFLGEDRDEDGFWGTVVENLRLGRIRMVFVVDAVPAELRRIVEFLARHLQGPEVYLVEVRQHTGASGKVLSTTVIGADVTRGDAGPEVQLVAPTLQTWITTFETRHGSQRTAVAREFIEWMSARGTVFTTTAKTPNLGMQIPIDGSFAYPFSIKANGKLAIELCWLLRWRPFDNENERRGLIRRAGEAIGIDMSPTHPRGELLVSMDMLLDSARRERIINVMQWTLDQLSTHSSLKAAEEDTLIHRVSDFPQAS